MKVEAKVALVGATDKEDPTAGAAVETVKAGKPGMVGAEPEGHETKKGVARVMTAEADKGVS